MSKLGEIRRALYMLKQQYGFSLSIYYRNQDVVNLATGLMTVSEVSYDVKKAIVLPYSLYAKLFKHFASSGFNYGGDLDIERRLFIIDRKDIPTVDIVNTEQWYLIYAHKRYSIEKLDNYEERECYFIVAKELTGTQVSEVYNIQVHDWLYLGSGFVHDQPISDTLILIDGAVH